MVSSRPSVFIERLKQARRYMSKQWTWANDVCLRAMVGRIPYDEIAFILGRSRAAIQIRAHRLGISERQPFRGGPRPQITCKRGHELTPDNLYIRIVRGKSTRQCKTCARAYDKERWKRLKALGK
jgi:hypothetical protein